MGLDFFNKVPLNPSFFWCGNQLTAGFTEMRIFFKHKNIDSAEVSEKKSLLNCLDIQKHSSF